MDTYCEIESGKNQTFRRRENAVVRLNESPSAPLRLIPVRREKGGKSVNMSIQSSKLGVETRHFGFMDNEVFLPDRFRELLDGGPAEVSICEFEDGSLVLARQSRQLVEWELEDLEEFGE
ncbi:MAG: hypothetical protein ABEK00_01195, partial [Candidatus Nanohaloarchaea archaeon]